MPAVTVDNLLVLPRVPRPDPAAARARPVLHTRPAHHAIEGAGFEVWRPFPNGASLAETDPFLLLDQLGPVEYRPGEAKGAPWHPHRGFETVTYVLDGGIAHHDSDLFPRGEQPLRRNRTRMPRCSSNDEHDEPPRADERQCGASLRMLPMQCRHYHHAYDA